MPRRKRKAVAAEVVPENVTRLTPVPPPPPPTMAIQRYVVPELPRKQPETSLTIRILQSDMNRLTMMAAERKVMTGYRITAATLGREAIEQFLRTVEGR